MSRNLAGLITAAVIMAGSAVNAQDGYRIIVNASNPTSSLSKSQIAKLFLELSPWESGAAAAPVDLAAPSPVRDRFSRDVLGLSESAVAERWQRAASAGGHPPPAVATDREVLAYVRLKPGAIGYVSANADLQGVRTVAVGKSDAVARAPVKLRHEQPVYPELARAARVEGTVEIEIVIGTGGDVEQARIVKSIPMLDDAAMAAVRRWKYQPGNAGGAPARATLVVRVTFAL